MTYSYKHVHITGVKRKILTMCMVGIIVGAASIIVKKIYFEKSDFPALQHYTDAPAGYKKIIVRAASESVELVLEIADTPQKRQEGLMFRRSLAKNSGMLFVFDTDTLSPFWMKNTLLPLDILFVDINSTIVDHAAMKPCVKDPCLLYASRAPYRYAIEINEGFVREKQIKIGDTISFLQSHSRI